MKNNPILKKNKKAINVNKLDVEFDVAKVIHQLMNSEYEFFLGGSRRMHQRGAKVKITDETDFDFYAQYTPETQAFLESIGFSKEHMHMDVSYYDDETVVVMEPIKTSDQEFLRPIGGLHIRVLPIQVVLRKDVKLYRNVFESLDPQFYLRYLWKGNINCDHINNIKPIFNMLFRIARNAKYEL